MIFAKLHQGLVHSCVKLDAMFFTHSSILKIITNTFGFLIFVKLIAQTPCKD